MVSQKTTFSLDTSHPPLLQSSFVQFRPHVARLRPGAVTPTPVFLRRAMLRNPLKDGPTPTCHQWHSEQTPKAHPDLSFFWRWGQRALLPLAIYKGEVNCLLTPPMQHIAAQFYNDEDDEDESLDSPEPPSEGERDSELAVSKISSYAYLPNTHVLPATPG